MVQAVRLSPLELVQYHWDLQCRLGLAYDLETCSLRTVLSDGEKLGTKMLPRSTLLGTSSSGTEPKKSRSKVN